MKTKLYSNEFGGLKLRIELFREKAEKYETVSVKNSSDIFRFMSSMKTADRETLAVVLLNTKNLILGVHICNIGSLNCAAFSPSDVLKSALLGSACSIILVHNHISGAPTASQEDIFSTKKLKEASDLIGVKLLDHIIVSRDSYHSMADNNQF